MPAETNPERLLPWFALKSVPRIGNILFKKLIERFSSPENVFAASVEELCRVDGISRKMAGGLKSCKIPDRLKQEIDRTLEKGFRIVTFSDEDYPRLLRHIPDPPPYLYVSGKSNARKNHIGVVGSRNPTSYGLSAARRLSEDLSSIGFAVASGMARGIDTAAHLGALGGGGATVAVLGSGLAKIYPPENRKLFFEISEKGAVISEFPLEAPPEPHHFPVRNRIISGMSLGVVVVEAAKKSGSLITARLAAEQNREVFAVPGSIRSCKSLGTHNLIKQGAALVDNARDILQELRPQMTGGLESAKDDVYTEPAPKEPADLNPDERNVLKNIEPYPIHIDDLIRKTSMESGRLASILLKLELEEMIEQLPGKCFVLKNFG
jgi:DNA processing protein